MSPRRGFLAGMLGGFAAALNAKAAPVAPKVEAPSPLPLFQNGQMLSSAQLNALVERVNALTQQVQDGPPRHPNCRSFMGVDWGSGADRSVPAPGDTITVHGLPGRYKVTGVHSGRT